MLPPWRPKIVPLLAAELSHADIVHGDTDCGFFFAGLPPVLTGKRRLSLELAIFDVEVHPKAKPAARPSGL